MVIIPRSALLLCRALPTTAWAEFGAEDKGLLRVLRTIGVVPRQHLGCAHGPVMVGVDEWEQLLDALPHLKGLRGSLGYNASSAFHRSCYNIK